MQTSRLGLFLAFLTVSACVAQGAEVEGNPLQAYRTMLDELGLPTTGKTVISRYVIREGTLNNFASSRQILLASQHLCAEAKGAGKVSAAQLPPQLSHLRDEEYLSERAILSIHAQANLEVNPADCQLRWNSTRTGSLSHHGVGVCLLNFDTKKASGRCNGARATEASATRRAPPVKVPATGPVKQLPNGIACHATRNFLGGDLTKDGSTCLWIPDATERKRLPGLLSNPLVVEVDFGVGNGGSMATAVGSGTAVDAGLFSIPPGFQQVKP